jgi:Spy/CpxP family protein refolding chaperone
MTVRRRWLIVALAASLALNAGFVAAVALHRVGHRHADRMTPPDFGFPPETQAKVEANFKAFHSRMEPLRKELQTERDAMLDLLARQDVPREVLDAQQAKIVDTMNRIGQATLDHFLEQKSLLTPDQQKTFFRALHKKMRAMDRVAPPDSKETRP